MEERVSTDTLTTIQTVDFCGLQVARLILGANPFGGFSHQSQARNQEMVAFHTPERIIETWQRAEAAGINTMITNNTSPNVMAALDEYLSGIGQLQWIAQVNNSSSATMLEAVDRAVDIGCRALYFHGARIDNLYAERDEDTLRAWFDHARKHGIPIGVAAHAPEAHLWVAGLGVADFHAVPFFNCGSLHDGRGLKFKLRDIQAATECIRAIKAPCIAYKIMAAGRIDPIMAFEYAFDHIKPHDVVNVGMHRGDRDGMVEENVAMVEEVLGQLS
ncbi:MAG: hypothetical protein CME15_07380 [Gemmatimonadetes bacterium]|jgi:hypothetical protein|nr:hypothetical protein [Gemmatimonadota bacterium]